MNDRPISSPSSSSNCASAPTVLILGANGRLGTAAVQAFANAGWRVLAQARRLPSMLPTGARALVADIRETGSIAAQAAGARAVLYAVNPVYTRWQQDALPFARAGMDIAQALDAAFLMPGNVYNFGESMPALLAESTPQRPSTRKGRIRAAMEAELELRAARGLRGVLLRAGDSSAPPRVPGWTSRSPSRSERDAWSTRVRSGSPMPGPIFPTWRAPSSRWRSATTCPASRGCTSPATR
jgi:nucleoside-diphosphate-sugar epimerase